MQRREFIAVVATAAVATATAPQASARAPAVPMGIEPPLRPGKYTALEAAAGKCIDAAEDCLRRCFGSLATEDTSMAACADTAYQLIAACRALRTMAAVNSSHVPIFAVAVEQACIACGKECDELPGIAE